VLLCGLLRRYYKAELTLYTYGTFICLYRGHFAAAGGLTRANEPPFRLDALKMVAYQAETAMQTRALAPAVQFIPQLGALSRG
jgi:hypothetical protein